MGLFDAIFGSGDEVTTEAASTLSPEQQAASSTLSSYLQGQGSPQRQRAFSGDLVAPLSSLESLSLSALEDRARAIATTGDPNIRAASEALMGILQSGPTDLENFIETNVRNPLREEFEDQRNATSARFADQFFGSARREADARNFEDFFDTLAATEADVQLRGRESDRNAILEAIGLAPELANAEGDVLFDLLDAGSVPREIEDRRLGGEFQRFQELQQRRLRQAGITNQFLGVPAMENITTVQEGGGGLLGGFLSAGAKAAGTAIGGPAGGAIANMIF